MARPIITTTFTPRVKPSTNYTVPRGEVCVTWDEVTTTWDSEIRTWDEMCGPMATMYSRPRYAKYVEDITEANIIDLSGELVQGISGNDTNKIDTVYT